MIYSWQQAALFNTTEVHASSDAESWTGTGFFILWQVDGQQDLFLVSNRHVLDLQQGVVFSVRLNRTSTNPNHIALSPSATRTAFVDPDEHFTVQVRHGGNYYAHLDVKVDIACIRCNDLLDPALGAAFLPMSQRMILDWGRSSLHPGQQVMYVGYPDGQRDSQHNLPIARMGSIASLPSVDYNGRSDFLIDGFAWGGSSGSPVFVQGTGDGPAFSLIGVVHATKVMSDGSETNLGLTLAAKSHEVLALIQGATSGKIPAQ
jgi:hypothetical protein